MFKTGEMSGKPQVRQMQSMAVTTESQEFFTTRSSNMKLERRSSELDTYHDSQMDRKTSSLESLKNQQQYLQYNQDLLD